MKHMREYSHEEFSNLVSSMTEEEMIKFSSENGGYPVFFRMSLDERLKHIPFIQTGSAVVVVNEKDEILLEERTDREDFSLPGGCQEIGEALEDTAVRELFEETGIKAEAKDLKLIANISGSSRRNVYPNGDIVYNNTSLYLLRVTGDMSQILKCDSESKSLKFVKVESLPAKFMDRDLVDYYIEYIANN